MFFPLRYILLDAPLLFCIMATVWSFVASWTYEKEKKSARWWLWSLACGFFLSCAIAVKFVGLFVVFWVGIVTVIRILFLWSTTCRNSLSRLVKEFLYRAACLIGLPLGCYILFFTIHLKVLNRSGPGDGFYSSAFQVIRELTKDSENLLKDEFDNILEDLRKRNEHEYAEDLEINFEN
jgi:dolichyl-phosphate-mannose-protein mannosyltransferase